MSTCKEAEVLVRNTSDYNTIKSATKAIRSAVLMLKASQGKESISPSPLPQKNKIQSKFEPRKSNQVSYNKAEKND